MKIMYHIALNWTEEKIKILNDYGIYLKEGYSAIQIEDNRFKDLKVFFDK